MEKETVEGLRLGTMLIIIAATLTVGLLVFWYGRLYSGQFFNSAAEQNEQLKSVELDYINSSGIVDVPVASIYTIVSREWRSVTEVSVYDKHDDLITTGTLIGNDWVLSVPLKANSSEISSVTAPELVLYAGEGGIYMSRLSGRAFVTVTLNESTKTYSVHLKLQQ